MWRRGVARSAHGGTGMQSTRRDQARQVRAVRRARTAAFASLIPGLGHLVAGRRRTGAILLTLTVCVILGLGLAAATLDTSGVERLSVRRNFLLAVTLGLVVAGLFWCGSILSAYRAARPERMTRAQRAGSHLVVLTLCLGVLAPVGWGASNVYAARDVLHVFRTDLIDSAVSPVVPATTPGATASTSAAPTPTPTPFADKPRINLLLLGGDGGLDRQGVRTDALLIASVDTRSGDTELISLPRNLQNVPLRPGTKLAAAYPNGFADFWFGIYTAAESNPALMPHVRPENAGAAAITDTVAYVTGLDIDYYALVNMNGFTKIVNALGGVTLTVRSGDGLPVPIGGSHAGDGSVLTMPHDGIPLGKQKLIGTNALWYARSRFSGGDAERQARQRCILTALARQADPPTVLTSVRKFTSGAKQVVLTNIPAEVLPDLVDLVRLHGKTANIDRITVLDVIGSSVHPNFSMLRTRVQQAVNGEADASAKSEYGTERPICTVR
jgi:LCP family protein required for cell wall assembly